MYTRCDIANAGIVSNGIGIGLAINKYTIDSIRRAVVVGDSI